MESTGCSPLGLRPPKMMASMGTPSGASQAGSMMGHWRAGAQKRELGCAQGSLSPGRGNTNNSHFQGHIYPPTHMCLYSCTISFYLISSLQPPVVWSREPGHPLKRSGYLSIMVSPAKLCEKRVGEELGFSRALCLYLTIANVAFTSAQRNGVRCLA